MVVVGGSVTVVVGCPVAAGSVTVGDVVATSVEAVPASLLQAAANRAATVMKQAGRTRRVFMPGILARVRRPCVVETREHRWRMPLSC